MKDPFPSRVIGFDPGLHVTGYGVIEGSPHGLRLVQAGVIRLPARKPLAARLEQLYRDVVEVLEENRPAVVAVEELFGHYARPKTAILMGHARGVLLLAAAQAGLPVSSHLPTRVKKITTGSGRASKEQMRRAIQTEFALAQPPEPADVADALAVALCHYHIFSGKRDGAFGGPGLP